MTCTQERGRERLYDRARVDARGSKGERETEEDLEKDRRERGEQGRVKELECGPSCGPEQGDSVTALCTFWRGDK